MADSFKTEPAVTDREKDKPEILVMWGVIGLMALGIVGWFGGGVPGAIFGAILGGLIGGYIAHRTLGRVGRVSKDMQMDRE